MTPPGLPLKTRQLYDECAQREPGTLFYQQDLTTLNIADDVKSLMQICQQLVNIHLFQVLSFEGEVCWRVRSEESAEKLRNMTADERLIYGHIESSTNNGIWIKVLKAKSNLHQTIVTRCIKSLETKSLIKEIRSVKTPKRKIYMLSQYQPSEDVSGGPFHTDGELDLELIDTLAALIVDYVKSESWAEMSAVQYQAYKLKKKASLGASVASSSKAGQKRPAPASSTSAAGTSRPAGYMDTDPPRFKPAMGQNRRPLIPLSPDDPATQYPTAADILAHVNDTGVIEGIVLRESDFQTLLDMLEFDGRLERMGVGRYRVARTALGGNRDGGPGNGLSEAPCGKCPVFNLCEEGGPVNAGNCVYFEDWLNI